MTNMITNAFFKKFFHVLSKCWKMLYLNNRSSRVVRGSPVTRLSGVV